MIANVNLDVQTLSNINLNPFVDCFLRTVRASNPNIECIAAPVGYFFNFIVGDCQKITLKCGDVPSNNLFRELGTCRQFCTEILNNLSLK